MSIFRSRNSKNKHLKDVVENLKDVYQKKLLPLEEKYRYHDFHSSKLEDSYFDSKPMVLLVGQYSVGKTTFIKHIIKDEFPGIRIGPEPTTDSFTAVMDGEEKYVLPGNAVCADPTKNFQPLSKFGTFFLNRFHCSLMPNNDVLKLLTFVDTPGILSGEKQCVERGKKKNNLIYKVFI